MDYKMDSLPVRMEVPRTDHGEAPIVFVPGDVAEQEPSTWVL